MKKYLIRLNQIEQVKKFSAIVTRYDADMDLLNGRYIIDAKSIMGIFSLDLSKQIEFQIHTEDDELAYALVKELKDNGIDVIAA